MWIKLTKTKSYLLGDGKGLHLNVSRGSNHRTLRLTGRTDKMSIIRRLDTLLWHCLVVDREGGIPASHEESSQQAIPIARTDLILVQQLVDHLLSHGGQTAGVQVEDDGT